MSARYVHRPYPGRGTKGSRPATTASHLGTAPVGFGPRRHRRSRSATVHTVGRILNYRADAAENTPSSSGVSHHAVTVVSQREVAS